MSLRICVQLAPEIHGTGQTKLRRANVLFKEGESPDCWGGTGNGTGGRRRATHEDQLSEVGPHEGANLEPSRGTTGGVMAWPAASWRSGYRGRNIRALRWGHRSFTRPIRCNDVRVSTMLWDRGKGELPRQGGGCGDN